MTRPTYLAGSLRTKFPLMQGQDTGYGPVYPSIMALLSLVWPWTSHFPLWASVCSSVQCRVGVGMDQDLILCESDPTVVECVCACMSACVSVCAHAWAHFPSRRIHSFHQILKGIYDLSKFRTTNQTPSAVGSMSIYD